MRGSNPCNKFLKTNLYCFVKKWIKFALQKQRWKQHRWRKKIIFMLHTICPLSVTWIKIGRTLKWKKETHTYPPAISEYGRIRKTELIRWSASRITSPVPLTAPQCTAKVIDGDAAVKSLKPTTSKTFGEYAKNDKSLVMSRFELVFDRYFLCKDKNFKLTK